MDLNLKQLTDLSKLEGIENAFELFNTYKGVSLVYKATLNEVQDNSVQMSVEPPYSVCLTWESSTIILDSSHSFAFTAQVDHFDIQKGIVELSELNPIDGGFGTKEMTRVEPDDPIPVKISNKEISIIGEMLDVSITDIGIRVNSLGEPPLGSGDMVQLALIVMGKNAGSSGTVVSIQPQGSTYRLGIRFTLEETVPDLLARYITHRRAEIHRELLDAYNTARGNGVNK